MQCASVKNIVRKGYLVNLITNGITAATQKLDTLKTHKKGLMQQLFPSTEAVEA